ncbi:uncharacterized protein LOC144470036 [Augochlora pura]
MMLRCSALLLEVEVQMILSSIGTSLIKRNAYVRQLHPTVSANRVVDERYGLTRTTVEVSDGKTSKGCLDLCSTGAREPTSARSLYLVHQASTGECNNHPPGNPLELTPYKVELLKLHLRSKPTWQVLPSFLHTRTVSSLQLMGDNNLKHEQNVGTSLFEKTDAGKQCWTTEDFILLNSRRMFQDLLPKVKVLNYEDDRYIALLMDYFHICLESVRKLSIGKTKHLMLKALADTMGGYLQVYILPLTRHSYYAGNIKYRNARKLFELYEELKLFLRSNGAGWLKPTMEKTQTKIQPIVVTPPKTSAACEGIITSPPCKIIGPPLRNACWNLMESSLGLYTRCLDDSAICTTSNQNNREIHHSAFKKTKRHTVKHKSSKNMKRNESAKREESFGIPLPFLDNDAQPNSIALPFKTNSLQSLYTEESAFVLVKYYVASVKCIESKSSSKTKLRSFNQEFSNWLQQSVQPRLDDEKWYPGFGGVLRVISSLQNSGAGTGLTTWRKSGAYHMMPKMEEQASIEPEEAVPQLYKDGNTGIMLGTTELISIAVVSALLVWLLVGLSLVCYRYLVKHSDECGPCEPQQPPPVAVLYKNKEYCENDTCGQKAARKSLVDKLREYWRRKLGKCRGSCNDDCTDEEQCLAAISYTSKDTVDVSNSNRSYQKRKFSKSVSANFQSYQKERIKKVYYSSDGSLTTNTDSPRKPR